MRLRFGLGVLFVVLIAALGSSQAVGAPGVPVISNYTDVGIRSPIAMVAGPDGALWFTNNGWIGRITTSGVLSYYADPSIAHPDGIAVGPDGALWFTDDNNSIGRITTAGVVTSYTDPTIARPGPNCGRARRRALVPPHKLLLDRAHHHRRRGEQLRGPRNLEPRRGITCRLLRGALVHEHLAPNSIGRITT